MTIFAGLSAFPITPADADGRVDSEALGRVLEPLVAAEVQSIGLLGSTGTYAYLSPAERGRALAAAREVIAGRLPLIVGTGALRTDTACALAQEAAGAGADALLIAPVSYTPLTEDEVFAHYASIARQSALPICIYNNPGTTLFTFSEALLRRLAELPRIAAVKMPLPPDLALWRKALPQIAIGYSGDWGCSEALLVGADAWFSVIGGILPRQTRALADAARRGDRAECARIEALFAPLWALFQAHGSLRVAYAIAAHLGLTKAAPPLPTQPMPRAADAPLGAVLDALAQIG